ncbi:hypothetical protein [Thalassobacillus sp. CUG 92003]|uniref:hypothetical protein n=1 Tax=Thalassobacillus sp. CUG 92003 TaxID=2736641 RepID=UPI0015E7CFD6|nr:hypothetical protein [Thalassobacillus sp. CUG 92003]
MKKWWVCLLLIACLAATTFHPGQMTKDGGGSSTVDQAQDDGDYPDSHDPEEAA